MHALMRGGAWLLLWLVMPLWLIAEQPSVFELPRTQALHAAAITRANVFISQGKLNEAETALREATKLIPFESNDIYNLACVLARQGKSEEALTTLEAAINLGFNQVKHLQTDVDFMALREREDFKRLVKQAETAQPDPNKGWKYKAEPVPVEQGIAYVSELNTAFDAKTGMLFPQFAFTQPPAKEVVKGFDEAGKLVRIWYEQGTAAGNHGDLYDNHDSDHSNMDYASFPQLTRIEFDDAAKKRSLHHGLQSHFFFNAPTLGNSSTALVHGAFWRCQIRHALTQPRGAELLALQYANNMIYFYPEHRDYDPGHNGPNEGYGDVIPANSPYWLLSQGSSGTDRPLMHAVALTMAAFRPEVKAELVKTRTLMPAVQMLFRLCYKPVLKEADYLTGKAHPTAFDGTQLDLPRLVHVTHEMSLATLPPLVRIKIVEEDVPVLGIDYFDSALRERICDTPSAFARVMKGSQYERRFVISAQESTDPQSEPLKYHFVVLRGDRELISIKPLNAAGSLAEVRVKYHTRRPIEEGAKMESNRVDIGIFTQNSKYYSAPAFLSLNYLDNQKREYDAAGRIVSIEYADPVVSKNYSDPVLDFKKNWRDDYLYDSEQRMIGWTRSRGEKKERFTFDGCLVTKTDAQDRPLEAKVVRYIVNQKPEQPGELEQQVSEELVRYEYAGNSTVGKRK